MSRREHAFPRCRWTGKVRFGEHRDATLALRLARRHAAAAEVAGGASRRREQRSYRCPDCRGWHLTSLAAWRATVVDAARGRTA